MTDDNGHVDGDDYTWEGATIQAGAVLNVAQPGTGAPAGRGRYSMEDTMYELEPAAVRSVAGPDLRTLAEREQDDVAALRANLAALAETVRLTTGPVDVALQVDEHGDQIVELGVRCDNLVDALQALTVRVATVERTVARLVKVLEVRL